MHLYRLQTTDYRLQTTDYRLQTTDYRLQTTDYKLLAPKCVKVTDKRKFIIESLTDSDHERLF